MWPVLWQYGPSLGHWVCHTNICLIKDLMESKKRIISTGHPNWKFPVRPASKFNDFLCMAYYFYCATEPCDTSTFVKIRPPNIGIPIIKIRRPLISLTLMGILYMKRRSSSWIKIPNNLHEIPNCQVLNDLNKNGLLQIICGYTKDKGGGYWHY